MPVSQRMPAEWLQNQSANSRNGAMPRGWPILGEAALHGLPGAVVGAIAPHTEADLVAVLVNLLSAYGNCIGRSAHFRVGADKHHVKLNAALVGETSKGRKGMSWGHVAELMHTVDPFWADSRVQNGLSSGEGLIHAVRDRQIGEDKNGDDVTLDAGAEDKRLLVMEGEFAGVLKMVMREGNTLSPIIRAAWDSGKLNTLTRNNPLKASDSHVTIIGHITRQELVRLLSDTDAENGFANRFIWIMVKRSQVLPFGGEWQSVDVASLVRGLSAAVEFGRSAGEMRWGGSARERWAEVYADLSAGAPGLFGAVTGRAEAQVLRIACIYALMDNSGSIELEHLEAALALWSYAEQSALFIFGRSTGDGTADAIEEALGEAEDGMSRTDIANLFKRHRSKEDIERALETLQDLGRVYRDVQQGKGRPVERWFIS